MSIVVPITDVVKGLITVGTEVTVRGWVRTRRDSKSGISFIAIYDGSCFNPLQVIVDYSLENYNNEVLCITTGCSIITTGKIVYSPGNNQMFELQASQIKVVGWVEKPDLYPISAKRHSLEYLRQVAHLRPRTNLIGAMTRVRNNLAKSLHDFFQNKGYLWISTPLITVADTEGMGEMFKVSTLNFKNIPLDMHGEIDFTQDFFGKEAFLTVSGQLNGEAYACALSKIYTFGPTFRAENSNTSRHLSEFWMIEPEAAFLTLDDTITLAEDMLKYVCKVVLLEQADDMDFFVKRLDKNLFLRLEHLIETKFIKIDYTEAIKILISSGQSFENSVFWGVDLSSEHERFLTEQYFMAPVVVKNYPKNIKAFYMRLNDDDKTVASMDIMLAGIGEIIGGSQREERLEVLDTRLNDMRLDKKNYWWYRDLRRYGTVPHSGFGLGFERLISYVTGLYNIRDVIPFPRTPRNANF